MAGLPHKDRAPQRGAFFLRVKRAGRGIALLISRSRDLHSDRQGRTSPPNLDAETN